MLLDFGLVTNLTCPDLASPASRRLSERALAVTLPRRAALLSGLHTH